MISASISGAISALGRTGPISMVRSGAAPVKLAERLFGVEADARRHPTPRGLWYCAREGWCGAGMNDLERKRREAAL
jgi:hypothetical protein